MVTKSPFKMCGLSFQDFLAETKKHYSAELESVDFKANAEEARVNINSWVEKQTQGRSHINTLS